MANRQNFPKPEQREIIKRASINGVPTCEFVDDLGVRCGCTKGLELARAAGKAEERERIAKWFEAKWIEESGPEWGLSSDEERKDTRDHNRRVMAYAAAIREAKP